MKTLNKKFVGYELNHGTLRSEDLIIAFMEFLQNVKLECEIEKEVNEIQNEIDKLEYEDIGYGTNYKDQETASYILNEDIWNLLNDIAPEFSYFSSSEGDGASFGFWTNEEALMDKVLERLEATVELSDDLEEVKSRMEEIMELMSDYDR